MAFLFSVSELPLRFVELNAGHVLSSVSCHVLNLMFIVPSRRGRSSSDDWVFRLPTLKTKQPASRDLSLFKASVHGTNSFSTVMFRLLPLSNLL